MTKEQRDFMKERLGISEEDDNLIPLTDLIEREEIPIPTEENGGEK